MAGQTLTWSSGTSGSWFDANHWTISGGTASSFPQTSDTAIVNNGAPVITSGGQIAGETIVLGGLASGGSVSLTAVDATIKPLTSGTGASGFPKITVNQFIDVTGGGSANPTSATLVISGATTFEGDILVEAKNGDLTISTVSDGHGVAGDFIIEDATDETLIEVAQESTLHLAGHQITNAAVIQVEGTLDLASGTVLAAGKSVLAGGSIVAIDGGTFNISGTVGAGTHVDFAAASGTVAIASGAHMSGVFGYTGIAGGQIDLLGVSATSEVVSGGVMTVFSGGTAVASFNVETVDANSLNPTPAAPQPQTGDFTLASDGKGGTLIAYAPQGPTVLEASLPAAVVAPTGSLVSLASILGQSFGPNAPAFYGITLLPINALTNTPSDQKYWGPEVAPAWYVNGFKIDGKYTVKPGDNIQLLVGNNIAAPAQIEVQVTPTLTSNSGVLIDYSIWTVDPAVAAKVVSSGAIAGHPTPTDVVNAAFAWNETFPAVNNNNLCNSIADDVAAAAGATMPLPNTFYNGSLNAEGGFWRIFYNAADVPNPPPAQDWSSLVQGGDIIRMEWFHPTSPSDVSGHSTTALGSAFTTSSGTFIQFYDNDDHPSDLPGSIIGVHEDNYWNRTVPDSITIYRLDPNQQYLIQGTSQSEVIAGSVYNNLIRPGGGADIITAGAGANEIQDITAHLSGITITDFHSGDTLDFTDLQPAQVTIEKSGTQLVVRNNGIEVAEITLPANLPPNQVFAAESDGASGTLVRLNTASAVTWSSMSGGNWGSGSNWTSGAVPDAGGYAIINVSGTYQVAVTSDTKIHGVTVFNSAATLAVSGATLTAGTLTTLGAVDIVSGGVVDILVSGTFQQAVSGGTVRLGGVSGTAATFTSGVAVGSGTKIDFAGAGGLLNIVTPDNFSGTIDGFAFGDAIDFTSVTFDSAGTVTLLSGNVLEIKENGATYHLNFNSSQSFSGSTFHLVSDRAGGTDIVLDTTVSAGDTVVVSSGQTVAGLTILSGGVLELLPGGIASDTIVSNGGLVEVLSSGIVDHTQLKSGGALKLFGGANNNSATYGAGAILEIASDRVESGFDVGAMTVDVLFAGTTSAFTIHDSGRLEVLDGGSALSTVVSGGGTLTVSNGGVSEATAIKSGGHEIVSSGGGAASATVSSGGIQTVRPGGTTDGTVLTAGGTERVSGRAVNTFVISGASLYVYSGGSASGTVLSGGIESVQPGGTAVATLVSGGGLDVVNSGAQASGAIVNSGTQFVVSGGVASGTTLNAAGNQVVLSGGVASATTINSGGQEGVYGSAVGAIVSSGGLLFVNSGARASGTTVNGGILSEQPGGIGIGTVLNSGGLDVINTGATASSTIVNSGTQFVFSGGLASGTTLNSGGNQVVLSGGVASATTVNSGGQEGVYGSAVSAVIAAGGMGFVYSGARASGTTVNGGILSEQPGGIGIGTVLNSGGLDVINTGATASGTIVNSGTQFVFSGGLASGTTLNSGGNQVVLSGGVASATTVNSGGQEGVYGSAVSAVIAVGGMGFVYSGARASGTTVNGGTLSEQPGGTGIGTVLNSGGLDVINTGATASGTIVNSGTQFVFSGGLASGTTLNSGGNQVVLSGGVVSATTVNNGGQAGVYGSAVGMIINSGGHEYVSSGGFDGGAHVNSGGFEIVTAGGTISGASISGGTLEIMSGGGLGLPPPGGATVTFALSGGGILQLDHSQSFAGNVAGFGEPDFIDLRDIVFSSATTLAFTEAPGNTSGTLTVSDGIHTANVTLLGQYATAQFTKQSDGHGGTLVGDPPPAAMTDPAPATLVNPHT